MAFQGVMLTLVNPIVSIKIEMFGLFEITEVLDVFCTNGLLFNTCNC